ncbi:MAG: YjfB family protein [Oscillospiraceae bacterium]|nr:YjfB family protein [Oscillospiraceae bacterium]
MEFSNAIAEFGMNLRSAAVMQQVSVSVQKMAMDASETAAQGLVDMMAQAPAVPKGDILDVYV